MKRKRTKSVLTAVVLAAALDGRHLGALDVS